MTDAVRSFVAVPLPGAVAGADLRGRAGAGARRCRDDQMVAQGREPAHHGQVPGTGRRGEAGGAGDRAGAGARRRCRGSGWSCARMGAFPSARKASVRVGGRRRRRARAGRGGGGGRRGRRAARLRARTAALHRSRDRGALEGARRRRRPRRAGRVRRDASSAGRPSKRFTSTRAAWVARARPTFCGHGPRLLPTDRRRHDMATTTTEKSETSRRRWSQGGQGGHVNPTRDPRSRAREGDRRRRLDDREAVRQGEHHAARRGDGPARGEGHPDRVARPRHRARRRRAAARPRRRDLRAGVVGQDDAGAARRGRGPEAGRHLRVRRRGARAGRRLRAQAGRAHRRPAGVAARLRRAGARDHRDAGALGRGRRHRRRLGRGADAARGAGRGDGRRRTSGCRRG